MEVTELMARAREGDAASSQRLFAMLYGDLRRLAAAQLRGNPVMHATSLVHEAFLKLANHGAIGARDRAHYFAIAAQALRQILIDHVRARAALRRGGDVQIEALGTTAFAAVAEGRDEDVLALDEALQALEDVDASLATLVEMRFFAGLELADIVEVLGRSERSLKRDWRRARAFLQQQLTST